MTEKTHFLHAATSRLGYQKNCLANDKPTGFWIMNSGYGDFNYHVEKEITISSEILSF